MHLLSALERWLRTVELDEGGASLDLQAELAVAMVLERPPRLEVMEQTHLEFPPGMEAMELAPGPRAILRK